MKKKIKYLKHFLQVTDDNKVMRENYSIFCTLMKDVEWYRTKNIDGIFNFLETLYSKNSWWYGCLSDFEALNIITNIEVGQGAVMLVYAPNNNHGQIYAYVKVSKQSLIGKKIPVVEIIKITEKYPISGKQFPIIFQTVEEIIKSIKSEQKVTVIEDHKTNPGYKIDHIIEGGSSSYVVELIKKTS